MNGRLMLALQGDLSPHEEDIRRLRLPAVGGVILFSRNFRDGAQLRQLTAALRRAAARPLLIAVDQEGGRVRRFVGDGFSAIPAMAKLAAHAHAEQLAEAAGIVLAAELLAHGVDLTFAPVLDIAHGNSAIIGERAFSADPHIVAALGLRLAEGLRRGGMSACGKHFPGHGYAAADSHETLPTDSRPADAMRKADWLPFASFAAAGAPLLMTAHIVYPAVDEKNPATFSSVWLRQILRDELGFRGLVVGDDLSMSGAVRGDIESRIRAAAAAGCDLWMVCAPEHADAACAATAALSGDADGNLWQTLSDADSPSGTDSSGANHPRVCVGDAAYRRARAALLRI